MTRDQGSFGVMVSVWGEYACFTRPEMKVERVSYDVMTPSAARGILEAILWKPAIRWIVDQIDVLRPIRWMPVRRNEVGTVFSAATAATAMKRGNGLLGIYVEDERQQRAALVLRDVGYTIHGHFEFTDLAGPRDNEGKFLDMFRRRIEEGQCFNQPYLGCREFTAFFGSRPPEGKEPIKETRDLGWMLHDKDYSADPPVARFFKASLENGVVKVPEWERGAW